MDQNQTEAQALLFMSLAVKLLEGSDPADLFQGESTALVGDRELAIAGQFDFHRSSPAREFAAIIDQFFHDAAEILAFDGEGAGPDLNRDIVLTVVLAQGFRHAGPDALLHFSESEKVRGRERRGVLEFEDQEIIPEGAMKSNCGQIDIAMNIGKVRGH